MELSTQVSSALRLLGDCSATDYPTFQAVLREVKEDIALAPTKDSPSEVKHVDGEGGAGVVGYCHAALMTLFLESVRGGNNIPIVTSTLEDLMWSNDRIAEAIKELESQWPVIQSKLASTGTYPPHVVDVDWQLKYEVRSNMGEADGGGEPTYLVTLHTEGGKSETETANKTLTFSCSLAELTHMVTRLRQATRAVQKYANNT